ARQLVRAGAQKRAQQVAGALQRPALGERRLDHGVELGCLAPGAAREADEPGAIDLGLGPLTLERLQQVGETMPLELKDHRLDRTPGQLGLVERLNGAEARGAAAGHHRRKHRFTSSRASAARAASPPLSLPAGSARTRACCPSSVVRMPLPIRAPRCTAKSIRPRALSPATMS